MSERKRIRKALFKYVWDSMVHLVNAYHIPYTESGFRRFKVEWVDLVVTGVYNFSFELKEEIVASRGG